MQRIICDICGKEIDILKPHISLTGFSTISDPIVNIYVATPRDFCSRDCFFIFITENSELEIPAPSNPCEKL